MSRSLTPRDCYALMNLLVKQATGQTSTTVVDTSSFVSAGELVMSTGKENVINSLSIVMGRTLMAVRPYKAKMRNFNAINTGVYTNRVRKISFYSEEALPSGYFNTDLNTNFAKGFTNGQNKNSDGNAQSTKSMWEQDTPPVLEMNFAGSSTWQDVITLYEDKLEAAFRSVDEFGSFISGLYAQKSNDIESQKEAFNRMTLLNYMTGLYDMGSKMPMTSVNLTTEFNKKFGTTHTSAELRTTYIKDFLKFLVATIKNYSDFMEERTANFHWTPEKTIGETTYSLPRHTPKDRQRLMLFSPLITDAATFVMPEIFNENYLKLENYEGVSYWQSNKTVEDRAKIHGIPAIPNDSGAQEAGTEVNLEYVVGVLHDEDAIMTDFQLERALSTPVEARKGYRNVWYTFQKNAINDFTENGVLFYMDDTGLNV